MPDSQRLESLLVADIGSSTTKVGLVDRVGSDFRFVSSGLSASTAEPPTSDVLVGLRRAIEFVQARTGRRFLSDDGELITPERNAGQGVDAFVATTSAPSPLRVVIVGVSREVSLATAVRAIHGTYATLEATLALDQTGGRWLPAPPPTDGDGADAQKKTSATALDPAVIAAQDLARANPDVIVIVGGIDGGATTPVYEIANLVAAIVASSDEETRPTILFAGNRDARSQVAARVGNVAPFRAVDNVRPSLEDENLSPLQRELEALYIERKITWLPGLNAMSAWTSAPVLPTARSFENVVRFIARRYNLNVLGADLGAASTTVVTSRSGGFSRVVRADLGLGQNLENVLALGLDRLTRWLPMEMDAKAAELRWLGHTLHPMEIPMTREDARLMDAAGRAALAAAATDGAVDMHGIDLILLTGRAFSHNSNPGSLALLVLDALQPSGIFTLAVDTLGLAPAFGALAPLHSTAAASTLERDGFVTLGTVIAPMSKSREGQIDLRVKVHSEATGTMNLEVRHGSLELVPLPAGQKASIEIYPSRGVDLGNRHGGVFRAQVEGGSLGVVIDARGRPIALPADVEKSRAQVQKWYWDIGGETSYG